MFLIEQIFVSYYFKQKCYNSILTSCKTHYMCFFFADTEWAISRLTKMHLNLKYFCFLFLYYKQIVVYNVKTRGLLIYPSCSKCPPPFGMQRLHLCNTEA
jgi:hypothetical protein